MHKMSIWSAWPQICDVTFVVNVLHWETNGPQMFLNTILRIVNKFRLEAKMFEMCWLFRK